MFGNLRHNSTFKNFSITGLGVALSQVIALASMPFIAKISGAEQFGIFSYYFSIATILIVVCSLRMESVLFLVGVEHINKLVEFFKTYYLLSSVFLLIPLVSVYYLFSIFEIEYLFVLCGLVYSVGVFEFYIQYNVRIGKFFLNSKIRVLRATLFPVFCFLFHIVLGLSAYWIIVSYLISNLLPLFVCKINFANIEFTALRRKYVTDFSAEIRKTAIFQVPAHFARTIASALIIILVGSVAGNEVQIGYFSLAFKLLIAPASIFILAVGDIFKRTLVSDRSNAISLINKITSAGLVLFLMAVLFVELFGLSLIKFTMGDEWIPVVDYMRTLYPLLFATMVLSPITHVYLILNRQQQDLVWQFYNLLTLAVATALAMEHSVFLASVTFSSVSAINLIMSWIFCYSILRKV